MFTSKKHLLAKTTPLSLINVLQAKHRNLLITETLAEDTSHLPSGAARSNSNPMYIATIQMGAKPFIKAIALESSKQKARHVAAQKFLKALFPQPCYTWNKVSNLITTVKDPLTLVIK